MAYTYEGELEIDESQVFKVENFEGPLDLLLFLIKSKKMSILEVDLRKVADQYINILMQDESLELDQASEYFLIASKLLSIKSKTILNNHIEQENIIDSDEENLIESLIKYERVKSASIKISEIFDEVSIMDKVDNDLENFLKQNKNFEEVIIKNTKQDLSSILEKIIAETIKKEEHIPTIKRRKISIEEILEELMGIAETEGVFFSKLIVGKDKVHISMIFLGVLELTSKKHLVANEKEGDIFITKNDAK